MTEIPEHLLRRAQKAREKAASESHEVVSPDPRIPQHLVDTARKHRSIPLYGAPEGAPEYSPMQSLTQHQLRQLRRLAEDNGLHLAADWLRQIV